MVLQCSTATPEDAVRIAEIHMAAFGPNAMLRAQFPTEDIRKALQRSIEMKVLAEIHDANTTVLIVRPSGEDNIADARLSNSEIIGFAKWVHPTEPQDDYQEPPWAWPEGTALDVLNDWAHVTEEAQNAAVGKELCYRLTFIATDPAYTGRGAGSRMVAWGIDRCEKEGVSAYLESTTEAVPFYERLGFASAVPLSLDISERTGEEGAAVQVYREVGMIYRPKRRSVVG